jgi:diaminohydroxyphosphoribosylaminopyrimidine deaminase/5-amino-6-(5-phosphoribosylamino)uracil reductase
VIASADPTALAGGGARHLSDYGAEIKFGVEEAAALELNAPFFFAASETKRPWVTLKLALSRNGKMNDPSGERRWISNEQSRAEVHRLRANVDAIAVGIGTVRADNPELTVRGSVKARVAPMRVIFDRNAETPLESKLVTTARGTPTMVFAHRPPVTRLAALHNAGVDVFEAEDLPQALEALRGFDVQHLFVEGGPTLAAAFLHQKLVDRLIIFQSPADLDDNALSPFANLGGDYRDWLSRLPVVRRVEFGEDVMSTYALHEA